MPGRAFRTYPAPVNAEQVAPAAHRREVLRFVPAAPVVTAPAQPAAPGLLGSVGKTVGNVAGTVGNVLGN